MLSLILGFAAPPAIIAGSLLAKGEGLSHVQDHFKAYVAGFTVALICVYVVPLRHCPTNPFLSRVVQRREAANKRYQVEASHVDDDYGMEHLWLNADLEPKTSWVNLGYWKKADTASVACAELFRELLDVSGITREAKFSILEIGSACAETALWLNANVSDSCSKWIGLTLSTLQVHVAKERLSTLIDQKAPNNRPRFETFHADASKPDSWSSEIRTVLAALEKPWLVALDVMVHFESGRESTLAFAKKELGASIAVTDIIRRDHLSLVERLKLRFSLALLDTPLKTVLTRSEYVKMLVDCGYKEENISIKPITEHVYRPYSRFVEEQGQRWQNLGGGSWDYADFWLVGSVLRYFADTGLVDSCIIVAHA